jgi:hypothetical protein
MGKNEPPTNVAYGPNGRSGGGYHPFDSSKNQVKSAGRQVDDMELEDGV